jgi:hypothetical protein
VVAVGLGEQLACVRVGSSVDVNAELAIVEASLRARTLGGALVLGWVTVAALALMNYITQ